MLPKTYHYLTPPNERVDDWPEAYTCCDCCSCQSYPASPIDQKVEILNRKYCGLYPKRVVKKLRPPPPAEDPNAPKYTKIDHQLESCVQEQLLIVQNSLQQLEKFVNKQVAFQCECSKRLFELSNKYKVLTQMGVCVKLYPEIVSKPTEHRLKCEFREIKKKLCLSTLRMGATIMNVKYHMYELDKRCDRLDFRLETPFIRGDYHQSSLRKVRNLIDDVYTFYSEKILKLMTWSRILEIGDLISVEDFWALVSPTEPYKCNKVLTEQLAECKCFRGAVLTLNPHKMC